MKNKREIKESKVNSKMEEIKQKLEKLGYEIQIDGEFMHVKLITEHGGVAYIISDDDVYYNDNALLDVISVMNQRVKQYMKVKEEL